MHYFTFLKAFCHPPSCFLPRLSTGFLIKSGMWSSCPSTISCIFSVLELAFIACPWTIKAGEGWNVIALTISSFLTCLKFLN